MIARFEAGTNAAAADYHPDPRLEPAAHQFEACLMKEFVEPLQHSALFDDDAQGHTCEGSGNALMGFGSEALARAISERGGFGIARKIEEEFVQRPGNAAGPDDKTLLRTGRQM